MSGLSTSVTPQNIQRTQTQLAENVVRIGQRTEHLPEAHYFWKPAAEEWSLLEVLAHLRSSADINQFRIFAMLAVKNPLLPLIHPRLEWQRIVPYARLSYADSLAAYVQQRKELLLILGALDVEGWKRSGHWDKRSYSIYLVARSMALHEAEHFEQIDMLVERASLRG